MARVNLNEVEQKDRPICVAIDEAGGEAMFDAAGQPTEKWKAIARLLGEYEADIERRAMCATLAEHGLLEPFNTVPCSSPACAVWPADLEKLNATELKNLVR